MTECDFILSISHGSRALFEFLIPKSIRILSVDGGSIKRWDVLGAGEIADDGIVVQALDDSSSKRTNNNNTKPLLEFPDDATASDGGKANATQYSQRVLKVWLDYGVEQSYTVRIVGETEIGATTLLMLPRLQALGVNREKGFIGIEARTNVELSEHSAIGLRRIGTSELPAELYQRAMNPLLLGYQFGLAETQLVVEVKKHKDVCSSVVGVEIESCVLELAELQSIDLWGHVIALGQCFGDHHQCRIGVCYCDGYQSTAQRCTANAQYSSAISSSRVTRQCFYLEHGGFWYVDAMHTMRARQPESESKAARE
jgi:hypothetical protein